MDTPTPTTKNIRLLRTVMELVTANPDWHDQDFWGHAVPGCGTTRCIAGWANALSGYEEMWTGVIAAAGASVWGVSRDGGPVMHPGRAAQDVLGLTDGEAGGLFYAADIDEVWEIVEDITDGEILRTDVEASVSASSRAVVTDVADPVSV